MRMLGTVITAWFALLGGLSLAFGQPRMEAVAWGLLLLVFSVLMSLTLIKKGGLKWTRNG